MMRSLLNPKRFALQLLATCAALLPAAVAGGRALPTGVRDEPATSAATLVQRGLQLRERGDDEAALEAFRKAHELLPDARSLAQMGLAEQALGRWIDARGHLREALIQERDPWITRRRDVLERAVRAIDDHLGELDVLGGVPGAEVKVNGHAVGALPLARPLVVPAGTVTLEVSAPA